MTQTADQTNTNATTITNLDLARIGDLLERITPGPWAVGNGTNIVRGLEVTGRGSYTCIQTVAEVDEDREDWGHDGYVEIDPEVDAMFIAECRQWVPALLAEVKRLHRLEAAVEQYADELRLTAHRERTDASSVGLLRAADGLDDLIAAEALAAATVDLIPDSAEARE